MSSDQAKTADLVAELRANAAEIREFDEQGALTDYPLDKFAEVVPSMDKAADALEALAAENERLRGIEERLCNALTARTVPENEEARLQYVLLKRILHGAANA